MGTPSAVVVVNGNTYQCPMCPEKTSAPYGRITQKIGACSKSCSSDWDTLPFDEQQMRIGRINGVKSDTAIQQAA